MAATTILVSIGVGAILIAAVGLVTYMSALVKNAYEIKVELQSELAESLKRIEDDVDKKAKWVKRDLVEEIQRSKDALGTDVARRLQQVEERAAKLAVEQDKKLVAQDEAARRERAELARLLDGHRRTVAALEERLRWLEMRPAATEVAPPAAEEAVAPEPPQPVAAAG